MSLRKVQLTALFIDKILTSNLFLMSIITALPDTVENARFDTRVSDAVIILAAPPPPPPAAV